MSFKSFSEGALLSETPMSENNDTVHSGHHFDKILFVTKEGFPKTPQVQNHWPHHAPIRPQALLKLLRARSKEVKTEFKTVSLDCLKEPEDPGPGFRRNRADQNQQRHPTVEG